MIIETDPRAAAALLAMQRNREQLLAAYAPGVRRDQFPRSATLRWVSAQLSGRSLASTVLAAALPRAPWLGLLGWIASRRSRR